MDDSSSPLEPVPVETVPPPQRRGRAGRDLPAAIAVGAGLAAVVIVTLYTVKVLFVGLVCLAVGLAAWELANALGTAGFRLPLPPVLAGAVATLLAAYLGGADLLLLALVLSSLAVLCWRLAAGPAGYARDATAGVFALFYVAYLAGFAMLLLRPDDGPDRVLVFVLLVVCSDVGGYAAGVLLGRHPMAPTVSPKKSWEGSGGSLVLAAAVGALALPLLLGAAAWQGALLGALVVVTATVGDLGESMVKRDLGIKDMGSLLPGHGGVMDRLDSLLPTAPVVWLLLSAFR